ncbi:MAG: hypothetical protein IPM97_12845 [Bdellovibrionaceae bacterium]|nr:hypothetical protein [Pseudobdellovibrionaceae bacterium]
MKKQGLIFAIAVIGLSAQAQNMDYNCKPVPGVDQNLKVGLAELKSIKTVTGKIDHLGFEVSMQAEVLTATDLMNQRGNAPVKPKVLTEKFNMGEPRSGTMLDLIPQDQNELDLQYAILHLIDIDVVTAGPIPEGTFNGTADLVLIGSYPSNGHPGTSVLKVPLECKVTVKY